MTQKQTISEIKRVEEDIRLLKLMKLKVKNGFLSKSIPLQIKQQKRLLKQLKSPAIVNIILDK
jgi:hypothetical protein